jgi:hypothetical protein
MATRHVAKALATRTWLGLREAFEAIRLACAKRRLKSAVAGLKLMQSSAPFKKLIAFSNQKRTRALSLPGDLLRS